MIRGPESQAGPAATVKHDGVPAVIFTGPDDDRLLDSFEFQMFHRRLHAVHACYISQGFRPGLDIPLVFTAAYPGRSHPHIRTSSIPSHDDEVEHTRLGRSAGRHKHRHDVVRE